MDNTNKTQEHQRLKQAEQSEEESIPSPKVQQLERGDDGIQVIDENFWRLRKYIVLVLLILVVTYFILGQVSKKRKSNIKDLGGLIKNNRLVFQTISPIEEQNNPNQLKYQNSLPQIQSRFGESPEDGNYQVSKYSQINKFASKQNDGIINSKEEKQSQNLNSQFDIQDTNDGGDHFKYVKGKITKGANYQNRKFLQELKKRDSLDNQGKMVSPQQIQRLNNQFKKKQEQQFEEEEKKLRKWKSEKHKLQKMIENLNKTQNIKKDKSKIVSNEHSLTQMVNTNDFLSSKSIQPNKPTLVEQTDDISGFKDEIHLISSLDYRFKIPKLLWIYSENEEQPSIIIRNNMQSISFFAKKYEFQLRVVTKQSFKTWLGQKSSKQIEKSLIKMNEKARKEPNSQFSKSLEKNTKILIMVYLLNEHGGIMMEKFVTIVEDFQWIEDIVNNNYTHANTGNKYSIPQYVGFFTPEWSSPLQKEMKRVTQNVEKYMRIFPGVNHFFLAGLPHGEYLQNFIREFQQLIDQNFVASQVQISPYFSFMNATITQEIFYENMFTIVSHIVIQSKQKQMDEDKPTKYRRMALDYYGLKLINKYYFPYKFQFIFSMYQHKKTFMNLGKYSLEQLEATTGPLRYVAVITPIDLIDQVLAQAKKDQQWRVLRGSFLQVFLFPHGNEEIVAQNKQKFGVIPYAPKWTTLPKIIWIYWNNGVKNSKIGHQLCVSNLKRAAQISGFKLIQVDDSNLKDHLSLYSLSNIQNAISNSKIPLQPQTISDLVRLSLLLEHGGVYMDASYISIGSFDWLVNIASYPTQYIFNRFGKLPKVFLFFNPLYGSPFTWKFNQSANTKVHWHIAYQSSFIAAEAGQEFIQEWLKQLLLYMDQPFEKTFSRFKECGIQEHSWTKPQNQYLIVMDAVKCVIGLRQKSLKSQEMQATDYYKIWSMSGYLGQQKFRALTDFDNPQSDDNLFFRRYSKDYTEGVIGEVKNVAKFYNYEIYAINQFLDHNLYQLDDEVDEKSFLSLYLYDKNKKITLKDGVAVLQ